MGGITVPKICKPDDPMVEELLITKAWFEFRYPEHPISWAVIKNQMKDACNVTADELQSCYEFLSKTFGIACVNDLHSVLVRSWNVKHGVGQLLGTQKWDKASIVTSNVALDWSAKNLDWKKGVGDWDAIVERFKAGSNPNFRRRLVAVWAQSTLEIPHDRTKHPFGTFECEDGDAALAIYYGICKRLVGVKRNYERELLGVDQYSCQVVNALYDAGFLPHLKDRKDVNQWITWFSHQLFTVANPYDYFLTDNMTLCRVRLQVIKDARKHNFFSLRQLSYFYHNCITKE